MRNFAWRARKTRFPGRNEWRWHLQLQAERLASPLRLASILAFVALWALVAHRVPQGPQPVVPWLLSLLVVYALLDFVILHLRPRLVAQFPLGSVLLDFLFAFALTWETGGGRSPILPILFLGVASASLRLETLSAAIFTVLYALGAGLMASGEPFFAASLLLLGISLTAWGAHIHDDRVEHLRDPLTGAFTRAYALFHLERMLEQGKMFSVGLIDLDHFKAVNDKVGHLAGDAVLQQYVHRVQSGLRAGDLLGRYGGDELLVVFEGVGIDEALQIAERLRSLVAEQPMRVPDSQEQVAVTVSIGVIESHQGMRTHELLKRVDQGLYQSKRMRNEVSAC